MKRVRFAPLLAATLLAGCGAPLRQSQPSTTDTTSSPAYSEATQHLAGLDRAAAQYFQAGNAQEAEAIVSSALPVQTRLLAAPRPTLEAMEAVADLDRVYGKILISNGYIADARMLFQKNVTRWKTWKPQTDETARRLKEATADIAECDKHMGG
ncbi:MAG TPA: hypothetical protein VHW09_33430 [Bryobacteraceae bacterium]|jgi:hypothetical protein|nr:hypothetical protein [Bryobacteraceae bacterium]